MRLSLKCNFLEKNSALCSLCFAKKTKSIPFESHSNPFWGHLISIPLNSMWITKMTTNHSGLNSISFFFRKGLKISPGWLGNSKNNILNRRYFQKVLGQRRSIIVVRCDLKIGGFWWWIFIPAFVMNFHFAKALANWKMDSEDFIWSERNPVNQLIWSHCLIVLPILRLYRCTTHPAPAVSSFGQERPQKPVGDSPSASSTAFYHQDGTDRRGLKLFQLLLSSQDVRCKHCIVWKPTSSITYIFTAESCWRNKQHPKSLRKWSSLSMMFGKNSHFLENWIAEGMNPNLPAEGHQKCQQ